MGDDDSPDTDDVTDLSEISRRKLLAMSSAAVAGGAAGCGGDGGGTPTPTEGDGAASPEEGGDGTPTASPTPSPTPTPVEKAHPRAGEVNLGAKQNVPVKARPFTPQVEGEPKVGTIVLPGRTSTNPNQFNGWLFTEPGTGQPWQGQHRHMWREMLVAWGYGDNPPMVGANNIEFLDNGCAAEVTLDPKWTYWDGTPVTTESIKMGVELRLIRGRSDPNAIEKMGGEYGVPGSRQGAGTSIEYVDDKTFRLSYPSPVNSWALGVNEFKGTWHTRKKPSVYKDLHQKYLDATSADEVDKITKNSWENSISLDEFVERGIGQGLWVPDTSEGGYSSTHISFEKREKGHPFARSTNLKRARIEFVPDRAQRVALYKNGEFDAVEFNDLGTFDVEASPLSNVNSFTFNCIIGCKFNFDGPMGDRALRQAVAYLVSNKEFKSLAESNGLPAGLAEWQASADSITLDKWVGNDFMEENFIDYGPEAKPEKAKQVLNDAGYSKQGGNWVKPDGSTLDDIIYVSASNLRKLELSSQYISGKMEEFGLPVELQFTKFGKWRQNYMNGDDEFDISHSWACGGYPNQVFFGNMMSSISDWQGNRQTKVVPKDWSPETPDECKPFTIDPPPLQRETTPIFHHPARPEFPAFGKMEGSEQKLQPWVLDHNLQQAQKVENIREWARQFAWYANWQMTQIAAYDEITRITGDQKNFVWGNKKWPGFWNHRAANWVAMGLVEGKSG